MMKKQLLTAVILFCMMHLAHAFAPFVIQDIRVEGLQRVSVGTVFNYFPLRAKEEIDSEKMAAAVRSLYESGLFKDVSVERDGRVVIVRLLERPVINSLAFQGNKDLKSKDLLEGYKQAGIAPGRVLNQHSLGLASQDLKKAYVAKGRYGTRVINKQVPLERNRVALKVEVQEGVQALVGQVQFVGNRVYSDKLLMSEMEMKPASWYTLLSKRDQFSQEKLAGDVDRLKSFYLDRGFLNFKVTSTDVALTPNKRSIVVGYHVSEGKRFFVRQIAVSGINNAQTKQSAISAITSLHLKDVYSRKNLTTAKKELEDKLGDLGYALAEVQASADPVEGTGVNIGFAVNLGQVTYIHKIHIIGNTKTRDDVVRRELREYEGGRFSASDVELSTARLRRLGYFESVGVDVKPVEGTLNQVDVVYTVAEKSTGSFKVGLGYGASGLGISFGLSHENFLGTGKKFDLDISGDKSDKSFLFNITDPYFTQNGVSLGYGVFYDERDTSELEVASYSKDELGFNIRAGVPINEYDKIFFGIRASVADFTCGSSFSECTDYVTKYARSVKEDKYRFNLVDLHVSWSRDSRDRAVFPTSGGRQEAAFSFGLGDVKYQKFSYSLKQYFSFSEDYTLKLSADLGYGKGDEGDGLPFFKKFFAGGATSVRGFVDGSLAPRTLNDPDRSLGGSFKTVFNVDLITPLPFLQDNSSLRLDTFIDIGYAFKDIDSFDASNLRSTYGIGVLWVSPVGPLSLTVAKPFRERDDDLKESFQFQLGSIF